MAAPNRKVIVVDDEILIAETLVMILHKSGFDAQAAYSGESAVVLARDFQPQILITDVIMSGMSGIETAIQVRSILPSCKILLFSGQVGSARLLQKARKEGYEFDILDKPIHPKELIAKLENLLP
jgi:DNA-binding response OmpR family regulator